MVFLLNSGDHDMTIPFLGTQAWIRSLNYSITEKWRPWMILDQVAGYIYITISFTSSFFVVYKLLIRRNQTFVICRYTKTYANKMTLATVKVCSFIHIYMSNKNAKLVYTSLLIGLWVWFIIGRWAHIGI